MEQTLVLHYHDVASADELSQADRELVESAIRATSGAYAPYSHFSVGAAVRLADGRIQTGNNQENMAYPSGLCAERVTLFAASSQSSEPLVAIAMVARDPEGRLVEASPCGSCRQVMLEYERRQGCPMRVLLRLDDGQIRCFDTAEMLLPFAFKADL
ncbi:MAG: cytidine deaminase [Bacteroidales bacterium]|nr:cytidine deaminase [Bacteroidales bacterium]